MSAALDKDNPNNKTEDPSYFPDESEINTSVNNTTPFEKERPASAHWEDSSADDERGNGNVAPGGGKSNETTDSTSSEGSGADGSKGKWTLHNKHRLGCATNVTYELTRVLDKCSQSHKKWQSSVDPADPDPPYTCFIGNLPVDTDTDSLRKVFRAHNVQTSSIRIIKGGFKATNVTTVTQKRIFGYADFPTHHSMMNAIAMNGTPIPELGGRIIRVDRSVARNKDDPPWQDLQRTPRMGYDNKMLPPKRMGRGGGRGGHMRGRGRGRNQASAYKRMRTPQIVSQQQLWNNNHNNRMMHEEEHGYYEPHPHHPESQMGGYDEFRNEFQHQPRSMFSAEEENSEMHRTPHPMGPEMANSASARARRLEECSRSLENAMLRERNDVGRYNNGRHSNEHMPPDYKNEPPYSPNSMGNGGMLDSEIGADGMPLSTVNDLHELLIEDPLPPPYRSSGTTQGMFDEYTNQVGMIAHKQKLALVHALRQLEANHGIGAPLGRSSLLDVLVLVDEVISLTKAVRSE